MELNEILYDIMLIDTHTIYTRPSTKEYKCLLQNTKYFTNKISGIENLQIKLTEINKKPTK